MIKTEEFGVKYYNINSRATDFAWWMNEITKAEVSQKISIAKKGHPGYWKGKLGYWKGKKRSPMSQETKEKISIGNKGQSSWNKGKKAWYIFSEEEIKAKSEKSKAAWERGCYANRPPPWNKGKKINNQTVSPRET